MNYFFFFYIKEIIKAAGQWSLSEGTMENAIRKTPAECNGIGNVALHRP